MSLDATRSRLDSSWEMVDREARDRKDRSSLSNESAICELRVIAARPALRELADLLACRDDPGSSTQDVGSSRTTEMAHRAQTRAYTAPG